LRRDVTYSPDQARISGLSLKIRAALTGDIEPILPIA
jgi:hypothetical protein